MRLERIIFFIFLRMEEKKKLCLASIFSLENMWEYEINTIREKLKK